jgi:acetoin utilization protein AcuC
MPDVPLLVFGPRSTTYDFGPSHPLTPRRFGPGIDLLRAVGASPGLAPEPASDDELLACHTAAYLEVVKRFSDFAHEAWGSEAGIGPGDDPAFHGMHEAAAAVAGGSIRAMEAILRDEAEHAYHPGGGLHHAMPARAAGFCIYNDPGLAIARARRDGLRVLYVDLDVHHGDGVQAIHAADPGVLTFSIHETGRYLFPGSGFATEVGEGEAAGSIVNVPLEPETGEAAWLAAVSSLVPELAAAFAPDIIVSQHGADSHAWDPLADLNNTTTAMGAAARLVDAVAHRWAAGRWLSTGGGGYGVYRVVPRAWALTWLAAAHLDVPVAIPAEWRDRWATEAARHGDRSLPETFEDEPNAGLPMSASQLAAEESSLESAGLARLIAVPRLIREAVDRGWWSPLGPVAAEASPRGDVEVAPKILAEVDGEMLERLAIAPRVVSALEPAALKSLLLAASSLDLTAAIAGDTVVGLVASAHDDPAHAAHGRSILAVGVTPVARRQGLATAMLRKHVQHFGRSGPMAASVTLAERDPVEPLDRDLRAIVSRRLLEHAGFDVGPAPGRLADADPGALIAVRTGPSSGE